METTVNLTKSLPSNGSSVASTTLHPTIYFLMWLNVFITTGGNLLTIVTFLRDKNIYNKPANIFILNLAVADLKVGLVSLPWFNLWWHYGDWIFGEKLCKFWVIVDFAACTESMIAMLLIGWDRLWMVRNIQSYVRHQNRRKTVTIILISWLICYIHFFATVLLWEPVSNEWNIDYAVDCDFPPNYSLKYTIYEVVSQFAIPMIILAYFNIGVFVIINKRAKRIQPGEVSVDTQDTLADVRHDVRHDICHENNAIDTTNHGFDSQTSTNNQQVVFSIREHQNDLNPRSHPVDENERTLQSANRHRKDRKAAFTLTLLVVMYAICWAPYNVVIILETLSEDNVATWLASFTEYLLWLNSAINPFLYVATNRQFRRQLKKMFHCGTN